MDCATNKTLAWIIGDRSAETLKEFYEKKLKHLNTHFYTDEWEAYQKILPNERLTMSKKNTIGIQQNNSNVRHFLARMTRRTKVVSKSETMVDLTLR